MSKTITVKGIGNLSVAPDLVILSMQLFSQDMDYGKAMDKAAMNIEHLDAALEGVGFEKKSVKTSDFSVDTKYEYRKMNLGNEERIFAGYVVNHHLKLEFSLDSKRLAKALSAIGSCIAHPQLSIAFTVKDSNAIKEEILRSATENARQKAKVLCDASNKKLGELLSIDYNWGELDVFSDTRYRMDDSCIEKGVLAKSAIDIEPEDIKLRDTVTFVWEIL